jgi:hypothetical protein
MTAFKSIVKTGISCTRQVFFSNNATGTISYAEAGLFDLVPTRAVGDGRASPRLFKVSVAPGKLSFSLNLLK